MARAHTDRQSHNSNYLRQRRWHQSHYIVCGCVGQTPAISIHGPTAFKKTAQSPAAVDRSPKSFLGVGGPTLSPGLVGVQLTWRVRVSTWHRWVCHISADAAGATCATCCRLGDFYQAQRHGSNAHLRARLQAFCVHVTRLRLSSSAAGEIPVHSFVIAVRNDLIVFARRALDTMYIQYMPS